jgi:uncharacterized protein YjbI with pentapeptide repeats
LKKASFARWRLVPPAVVAAATLATAIAQAIAQEEDALAAAGLYAPSAWNIRLGQHASELPVDEFINFACGTNGGPPSLRLNDWSDYGLCQPEPDTGFREVYFEYDNEIELWAKAHNLPTMIALYQYTSAYEIPVIVSGLFDDRGFLVGRRIVSDPRVAVDIRERGVSLGGFLLARYGVEGWTCVDNPPAPGEEPYLGTYENRRCEKDIDDPSTHLVLETWNLRRPGERTLDPITNQATVGQFRSETRLEETLAGAVPDADARLAAIEATRAQGPTERDQLIQQAMNCPGCDLGGVDLQRADLTGANLAGANLAGANFKRSNLTGANLAGADLTGANLHASILRSVDLTGAILTNANLNGADVKLSRMASANLVDAMMYAAALDGADLSNADLTGALASHSTMARATLQGANMTYMDLRAARLNDADFRGADIRATWLDDALMIRSDFSGALLSQSLLRNVNLSGARLVGAMLRATNLNSALLRDVDLTGADFTYADLTYAILSNITASGAVWTDATLPRGFTPP